MKTVNVFFAVVLSVLLVVGPTVLAESCGKITYIEGRVDKKAAGEKQYFPALVGDEVGVGDTIRTKTYSKTELLFDDESLVRLADSSQVNVKEYDIADTGYRKNAVLSLTRGKMRAIVSKNKDKTAFCINTPNTSGSVKGSDVFVSYQKSATGILVLDGMLKTINTAFPDEIIDIHKGSASYVPYDAPPQIICLWRRSATNLKQVLI